MKMVSQLTRQAMRRHRLISACSVSVPVSAPAPASQSISPQPTGFSLVQPLYAAPAPSEDALPLPKTAPPRPRTIYQQLMTSHDRMTERHLPHT